MTTKPILTLLAIGASVSLAQAQGFTEDFNAEPLDPAWVASNPGHLGIIGGSYYLGAPAQGGGNNPKLQRFDTAGSWNLQYTHSIDVVLQPFAESGGGGTQSDFKWKAFGPDGFTEIVLNSFGDMRLFHADGISGGNIQPNTNIGYTDGDLLNLTTAYDLGTDTINVTYSLNGGGAIPFYSGGGINGTIGDTVGNFVEVENFKWGASEGLPFVAIDEWNLVVVPEPTTAALVGLGSLSLFFLRRRS